MALAPGAKVCVTGASGFIASHIVKQLLEKGYTVHGTVRDASNAAKTAHLTGLPGASERLKLFSAGLLDQGAYKEAISGCCGVFHVASPLPPKQGIENPEELVIRPAVEGTKNVLTTCKELQDDLKVVVVTSSMAAIAPQPEPETKSEEMWSDPELQQSKSNYYGASKTLAERTAWEIAKDCKFRLVTICPTMVLGPMLQSDVNFTMGAIMNWYKTGREGGKCPNDSMSFVDVRDCAAQHIAAAENEQLQGRFMSLVESMHWNDLCPLMKSIYPKMPDVEPCENPVKATQFDHTKQKTLGVELRSLKEILSDAKDELVSKGLL